MKTLQVSDELHARLKGMNAKNMDAAIESLRGTAVVEGPGSGYSEHGAEVLELLNRLETRLKNVQDKLAGLERSYAEMASGRVR